MKSLSIIFVLLAGVSSGLMAQQETYLTDRIMVEGFYRQNLGNFQKVWHNSVGGTVSYGIAFPDHNLLVFRTGVFSNQLQDSIDAPDASSTVIPLQIGGRYYFNDAAFMPYVSFMSGLNIVLENTSLEGEKEDRTLVKYAWQVGMGVTANFGAHLLVDLSANYNSDFYHTEAMMTGFTYMLGLGWRFN